jgi:hypothetical protein
MNGIGTMFDRSKKFLAYDLCPGMTERASDLYGQK